MSLINEMLRDLEARGGSEPAAQVRIAPKQRARGRKLWPVIAVAAVSLACLSALVALQREEPDEVLSVAAQPSNEENKSAAAAGPEVPPRDEAIVATADLASREIVPVEHAEPKQPVQAVAEPPTPEPVVQATPEVVVANPVAELENIQNESVIVRRHEPTREEIAARAGRDGFAALRNGDWATAARLLQELVAFEPANDDAREGLVVALTRQGRIAEADGALIDGVALGAVPARFAKLRARLQAGRGELDAALTSLSIAIPGISADPEYHALKAALAQQAERYDVAATTYSALTAFEPSNGTWQAGLGMALDKLGDVDGARNAYERALSAGQLDAALLAHMQRRVTALTDQER